MPDSERMRRRRAERDARGAAISNASADLARQEAERAGLLKDALAAAADRRAALAATCSAETRLVEAIRGLRRAGMTLVDAAATVELDPDVLGRVMVQVDARRGTRRVDAGTAP